MSSNDSIQKVLEKEIETLQSVAKSIGDLDALVDSILACEGRVIVTGMGKSGLIGRKISATLSSTATPSAYVHPAEALHGDIGTVGQGDLVIVLSGSGETDELLTLLPHLKRRKVSIAAICCKPDSALAHQSDFVVALDVQEEADPFSLIPTCSTTAMLAVGDALAIAVLVKRGLTREAFAELHPSGSIGRKLLLQVGDIMHKGEQIPRIAEGTSLREAVYEMGAKRLGATFVVASDNKDMLKGIFTDGDLRRQLEQNPNPLNEPIDLVMTPSPLTIDPSRLAVEAVEVMQDRAITILPVMKGSNLCGAIHLHDLIKSGLG